MRKRAFSVFLVMLCLVMALTACEAETYKSFTVRVNTGDVIEVEVITSDGHDLSTDLSLITILNADGEVFECYFMNSSTFEDCRTTYDAEEAAELIAEGEKDGNTYLAYSWPGGIDYFVNITDSNTAVAMTTDSDAETAALAFDAVSFFVVSKGDAEGTIL